MCPPPSEGLKSHLGAPAQGDWGVAESISERVLREGLLVLGTQIPMGKGAWEVVRAQICRSEKSL